MSSVNPRCQVWCLGDCWPLASCWHGPAGCAQQSIGATFGNVIQLPGGTPSDIVLDELRHRLYLVNNNTSQVDHFRLHHAIRWSRGSPVGKTPAGRRHLHGRQFAVRDQRADRQLAHAANAIDLSQNRVVLHADAAVDTAGRGDGRTTAACWSAMVGTRRGRPAVPQNTLAVFDPVTAGQLLDVTVPALPTTPAPAAGHHADARPTTTSPASCCARRTAISSSA